MSARELRGLPPEMLLIVKRYAVYRCFSDSGELLYIGETGELGKRLAAHAQKAWFTQVRGISLEWYSDELDALNAERRAIHIEHPKYNVQHRNSTSIRTSAPARRKRRTKSRGGTPARSAEESRRLALAILAVNPDISGAQLGLCVGKSVRWGQLHRDELAGMAAEFAGDGGNEMAAEDGKEDQS